MIKCSESITSSRISFWSSGQKNRPTHCSWTFAPFRNRNRTKSTWSLTIDMCNGLSPVNQFHKLKYKFKNCFKKIQTVKFIVNVNVVGQFGKQAYQSVDELQVYLSSVQDANMNDGLAQISATIQSPADFAKSTFQITSPVCAVLTWIRVGFLDTCVGWRNSRRRTTVCNELDRPTRIR